MGLAHSPRIVTDGLVLALDAGNVKGYDSKENRILYSEDLTQWGNTSSVDTSNTQIAPNGTQTADEVYATSATVNQGLINRSSNTAGTFVQNSWHTFSVHWKAGTSSGFRIQLPWNDGGNAGVFATFVESGGEVSVPTVGGYGNRESGGATVEKLNNGWYRFSITFRPTGVPTGSYVVWLFPSVTSGGDRTTNTTSYIWGAQTEVGQSVTTYVKTEASNKIRGTTLTDRSGKGNDGTLTNGPTFDSANGGSIVFDGSNDYVDCGNSSISTGKLTVNAWIKINTGSRNQHIVDSSSNSWHLAILNNNRPYLWNDSTYHSAAPALTVGQWYMLTGVQGTTLDIYINGVLGQSISSNVNISSNIINLGRWQNGGRQYAGNISQVSIYNKALSASEISQNFNALRGRFGI